MDAAKRFLENISRQNSNTFLYELALQKKIEEKKMLNVLFVESIVTKCIMPFIKRVNIQNVSLVHISLDE